MDDFELDAFESYAKIVVIGVGGAGSNAVNQMLEEKIANIEFWVFNTDAQALATSKAENRLVLGRQTTRGLGAGGDPQVGREAALDSVDDIKRVIPYAWLLASLSISTPITPKRLQIFSRRWQRFSPIPAVKQIASHPPM